MSIMSRIAKKIRRRLRKKGSRVWDPSKKSTVAENLINNNWGLRFDYSPAAGKGVALAAKRLAAKLKENKKIPIIPGVSRQSARYQIRRMERMVSYQENISYTRR